MGQDGCRTPRAHFGFYPFRWSQGWQVEVEPLLRDAHCHSLRLAPVLERLVFPRAREAYQAWLGKLASLQGMHQLISAHYDAPIPLSMAELTNYAADVERREWSPSQGPWQTLAAIDRFLLRLEVVPDHTADQQRE